MTGRGGRCGRFGHAHTRVGYAGDCERLLAAPDCGDKPPISRPSGPPGTGWGV